MVSLGVAALHGLLSSLSACVYPLIPITTALFGAGQVKNWAQGFMLSGIYVAGMSLTYVALGITAALTGSLFGAYLGNPWVIALFAIMFFYLGFAFAGLLPLPLPNFADKMHVKKTAGIGYPLVLGIISGFIAAPCTAPLFGALLIDIAAEAAKNESILPGVSQALAFSLGMGLPFLLIGGFALKLPKPGNWLNAVKVIGGIVLLAAGFHYAEDLIKPFPNPSMGIGLAFVGLFLVLIFTVLAEPMAYSEKESIMKKIKKTVYLAIAGFGLFLLTTPLAGVLSGQEERAGAMEWRETVSEGLRDARSTQGYIIIDFWADWCHSCHEMEKHLFHSEEFEAFVKANKITLVRLNADLDENGPVASRYDVKGLPTLVITDSKGEMIYQIVGFRNKVATMRELEYVSQKYLKSGTLKN